VLALKPHYAVVSLPSLSHAVAFLPRADFNTTPPPADGAPTAGPRSWAAGAEVAVRVAALPSAANGSRLVVGLAAGAKDADGKAKAPGGASQAEEREAVVTGTVAEVGPLGLEVKYGKVRRRHAWGRDGVGGWGTARQRLGGGGQGWAHRGKHLKLAASLARILTSAAPSPPLPSPPQAGRAHLHIGEVVERLAAPPADSPLAGFAPGQAVTAAYLGHIKGLAGRRGKGVELSLRPSALAAAKKVRGARGTTRLLARLSPHQRAAKAPPCRALTVPPLRAPSPRQGEKVQPAVVPSQLSPGDRVVGWVQEAGPDCLWLSLGPAARGRVHMFDAVDAPRQCAGWSKRFKPGEALGAVVVAVDAKRQKLDLSLREDVAMRPHAAGEALPEPGG
jgi:hypothetical protein